MSKYLLDFTELAKKEISKHKKSGNQASIKKLKKILEELKIHPETGVGKPEQLKYNLSGFWSRQINQKDRIVYSIEDDIVTVTVVSAMGHYEDK